MFRPLEILLVDDGSTDASIRVAREFCENSSVNCKVLTHERNENRGLAKTYQLGIDNAVGKFVAFLEQDDVWHPFKLSAQMAALAEHKSVGVVLSRVHLFDRTGWISARPFRPSLYGPPENRPFDARWRLACGNFGLTFSSILVRRELLWDAILPCPLGFQDWMMLMVMAGRCTFMVSPAALTLWYRSPTTYHRGLMRLRDYRRLRRRAWRNGLSQLLRESVGLGQFRLQG